MSDPVGRTRTGKSYHQKIRRRAWNGEQVEDTVCGIGHQLTSEPLTVYLADGLNLEPCGRCFPDTMVRRCEHCGKTARINVSE